MKKFLIALLVVIVSLIGGVALLIYFGEPDPYVALYADNCATCHGENMEGTPSLGPALVGRDLKYGDSTDAMEAIIRSGAPQAGMPAWASVWTDADIRGMAIFLGERRAGRVFSDFKVKAPLEIPEGVVETDLHSFQVEVFATGLHPQTYSIAPLPDGSMLVTEKTRGVRVISAMGDVSDLVEGTPKAFDDSIVVYDLAYGKGLLLDILPHPDYESNGWIYLHYTDRCEDCEGMIDVSMNRIVRARIRDGAWVDEQVIWEVDKSYYTATPDVAAGGRMSFDDQGHLYFSVGVKGRSEYLDIQDIDKPYGKVHRIYAEGGVPPDNPYLDVEGAFPSVYSVGHRSPQGLEYSIERGQLWETEMGPRGGDELNLIQPGKNYGWPLTSLGLDYDGTPVEGGKELGIAFEPSEIEQPRADFTPSPALSSFTFYRGDLFPQWHGAVIAGSLKGRELYRIVLENDYEAQRETLLSGIGRIRDVEMDRHGYLFLLLENAAGSTVVRLVPSENAL